MNGGENSITKQCYQISVLWTIWQSEYFSGCKCCCKISAEWNELLLWRYKRSSRSWRKKKKQLTKLNFSITFLLTTSLNKREKSVGNLNTGDYSSLSHPLDNKVDALSIHDTRQRTWEPLLCNSLVTWQHLRTADMQNAKPKEAHQWDLKSFVFWTQACPLLPTANLQTTFIYQLMENQNNSVKN